MALLKADRPTLRHTALHKRFRIKHKKLFFEQSLLEEKTNQDNRVYQALEEELFETPCHSFH